MKTLIFRKIMVPIISRAGTFLAAFLIGTIHADPVVADQFATAVGAVVLIGFDLLAAFAFGDKGDK